MSLNIFLIIYPIVCYFMYTKMGYIMFATWREKDEVVIDIILTIFWSVVYIFTAMVLIIFIIESTKIFLSVLLIIGLPIILSKKEEIKNWISKYANNFKI